MARGDRPRGPEARRPRARPSEAEAGQMREARRARAAEELFDVRPRPGYAFWALDVRNPMRKTRYRVLFPAYPSLEGAMCGCTDFATRGLGMCKHIEAGRLWLDDRRQTGELAATPPTNEGDERDLGPVWAEIDRRLAARERERGPAARRLRGPGAALYRDASG